jgi:hypothetical protein
MMTFNYQARWISKTRADASKKHWRARGGILLAGFKGLIIVEPKGTNLGDGKVLSPLEADYEIQATWCLEPPTKIAGARQLLGLRKLPRRSTPPDEAD